MGLLGFIVAGKPAAADTHFQLALEVPLLEAPPIDVPPATTSALGALGISFRIL